MKDALLLFPHGSPRNPTWSIWYNGQLYDIDFSATKTVILFVDLSKVIIFHIYVSLPKGIHDMGIDGIYGKITTIGSPGTKVSDVLSLSGEFVLS